MSKIISGHFQGMVLKLPKDSSTRPTSGRTRESVLNSLHMDLEGKTFLDLFAGTGAMGLEALSRGAFSCSFVEQEPKTFKALKENIDLAVSRLDKQDVSHGKVTAFCEDARQPSRYSCKGPFDYIWLDPPYSAVPTILSAVFFTDLAAFSHTQTQLFIEMAAKDVAGLNDLFNILLDWKLHKVKKMGLTAILEFARKQ